MNKRIIIKYHDTTLAFNVTIFFMKFIQTVMFYDHKYVCYENVSLQIVYIRIEVKVGKIFLIKVQNMYLLTMEKQRKKIAKNTKPPISQMGNDYSINTKRFRVPRLLSGIKIVSHSEMVEKKIIKSRDGFFDKIGCTYQKKSRTFEVWYSSYTYDFTKIGGEQSKYGDTVVRRSVKYPRLKNRPVYIYTVPAHGLQRQ